MSKLLEELNAYMESCLDDDGYVIEGRAEHLVFKSAELIQKYEEAFEKMKNHYTKRVEHATKRVDDLKDEHGDNSGEIHTYYGGQSLGHWQGKLSAYDSVLGELEELEEKIKG